MPPGSRRAVTTLEQSAEGGGAALGNGALQHVGAQRVDVGEDELLASRHRSNDARRGTAAGGPLPEDAQARVFALGAAMAGDPQPE